MYGLRGAHKFAVAIATCLVVFLATGEIVATELNPGDILIAKMVGLPVIRVDPTVPDDGLGGNQRIVSCLRTVSFNETTFPLTFESLA